jgi:hypothetical protein
VILAGNVRKDPASFVRNSRRNDPRRTKKQSAKTVAFIGSCRLVLVPAAHDFALENRCTETVRQPQTKSHSIYRFLFFFSDSRLPGSDHNMLLIGPLSGC